LRTPRTQSIHPCTQYILHSYCLSNCITKYPEYCNIFKYHIASRLIIPYTTYEISYFSFNSSRRSPWSKNTDTAHNTKHVTPSSLFFLINQHKRPVLLEHSRCAPTHLLLRMSSPSPRALPLWRKPSTNFKAGRLDTNFG
jgi:hypothetical protein